MSKKKPVNIDLTNVDDIQNVFNDPSTGMPVKDSDFEAFETEEQFFDALVNNKLPSQTKKKGKTKCKKKN